MATLTTDKLASISIHQVGRIKELQRRRKMRLKAKRKRGK